MYSHDDVGVVTRDRLASPASECCYSRGACATFSASSRLFAAVSRPHEVSGGGHVVHREGQGATAPALLGGAEELLLDGHLACDLPGLAGGRRSRCGVRRAFYKKARHVIQKLSVCDSVSSRRCRAVWRCWPCFVLGPAFGRARAHRAPATRVRFIFYLRPRWTVWRPERTHNLRCGQIQKKKSRAVAPRGRESERRRAQSLRPWSGQSHAAPAHLPRSSHGTCHGGSG